MDHMHGLMMADPSLSEEQRAELDRAWQGDFGPLFDRCTREITTAQYECVMSSTTLAELARCDEINPEDAP
jgi:hypothetical protein